jgi:2,5-diamino-6-(ribosylamino)-4(3H)-pyrimidinone 5'-phosphate reductase
MSADGKLSLPDRRPVDISSAEDLLRVHRLRASCDAILVGATTILSDDPKLHVNPERVPDPPAPLKVVLDSSGRVPGDARFLHSPGHCLVATVEGACADLGRRLGDRAEVRAFGVESLVDLRGLLAHLADRGVGRLLVEGGGKTLWSFLSSGLVDELSTYIGPYVIGGCDAPTPADGDGAACIEDMVRLEVISAERLGEGVWIRYKVTGRH